MATIAAMSGWLNSRWIATFTAAAALFALPTAAQATLTYVKNPFEPVVFAAADDGSGAHRVGSGSNPQVSPDGLTVAYQREGAGHSQNLMVAAAAGGPSRALMSGLQDGFNLAFSPDSQMIAALRGPELGKRKLVLVDVASGAVRVLARGYFSGFSFSPDGTELVYAKSPSEKYPPRSGVYTVGTDGGKPVRITSGHNSQSPLWGPAGEIAFVKLVGGKQRRYGPKNELFLMSPQGKQVKRLTHTKVDPLLLGLVPTEWSADGKRLLAEFEGQDTSYAVAVNPQTGAQRPLDKAEEQGFVGTALSRDGGTVLGFTGGFEPEPNHDIATIPYGGGKLKILVKDAYEPDWSR
jgi:Tol biopolymer transport system component